MQVGDIVRSSYDMEMSQSHIRKGIIIETDINMWGEEVVPSGVRIMWSNDEIETVYADEIEVTK
tara:strand:+ start:1291 stop:1482 length:192 start_codon:yes stop_codon:yes gene_type:complete